MVFKEKLKSTLVGILIACIIIVGFGIAKVAVEGRYAVEATEFNAVVELGEDLSLDGIEIVDNLTLGLFKTPANKEMIVRSDSTDTPGHKELVISRGGKEYVIHFDVKCRIEFVSGGTVVDTQLVCDASEIVIPDAPAEKTGYEFSHWDIDTSAELTGNMVVEAVFNEIKYPSLAGLTATYGDTLAAVELGSNSYGYWEFIDSLDTPVGNAGNREHGVRFVFFDDPEVYKYDYATVRVEKAEYVFEIINESFYYDGEVKTPSIDGINYIYAGGANVLPGVYSYSIEVIDDNYRGIYEGTYEILKPTVTVTVSSATIAYPAGVPTFTFTVEGFENVELLGIEIDAPEFATQVGEYEIGITYTNENVNYIVHKGTLTVVKGDMTVEIPEISEVTFEDKLADIEFLGKYLGTWAWESPETVVDDINGIVAYAIFTYDDPNLNPYRVAIEIKNIAKKTLSFNVTESVFVYEAGTERVLGYEIVGGNYPEIYATLAVSGNDPAINAGVYRRTLVINDPRYEGSVTVELTIEKATPSVDFTTVYETVWNENLLLESIELPEGYSWQNPVFKITEAGVALYTAIYTPDDTDNYLTVTGEFTVNVAKAELTVVGVLDSYVKTYDTLKFDIKNSGIAAYYTDGTLSIKYYKDGVEVDEIVNAGEYLLVVAVSEGKSYLGTTVTRSVTVNRAVNEQSVLTQQSAVYLNGISVLTLPESLEGDWSWLETEIGSAGTKTFTAIYTPDENGNYYPREVAVTVTVSKITVEVPSVGDKLYTGDEIDTGLTDTEEYTVSGDITAINAGSYYVTFTLIDPDNYEWKGDSESVSVTRGYKISNALNSWKTEPQNITAVYSGNPVYMIAEAEHGSVTIVYTLNGVVVDAPIGVGVYKVTVTALADNYDDFVAERTIEITHNIVPVPTVGASFPYNGREQGIAVNDSNLGVLYVVDSETRGTNAESVLSITLKLKDAANYKWETTDAATVTFTAKITKITASFTGATTVNKTSWTYTDVEGTATLAPVDSTSASLGAEAQLLYSYNNGAFVTYDQLAKTGGRLNAGTYAVKSVIPASVNWDAVETATVVFTVNKATPNGISVNWGNSPKTDGLYYQNLLTLSSLQISYNSTNVSVTYTYGISSEGFKAADTKYTFNVTPTDLVNFNSTSFDVSVPLKTVATIGHGGTPYGTIEDAVDSATSGNVVWVVADTTGNVVIKRNLTIPAGVTLRLPYGSGSSDYNKNQQSTLTYDSNGLDAPAETNPGAHLKTYVILAVGKRITVNGTLEISGELSGGGYSTTYQDYAGHTARYYALLQLETGSIVDINGTVYALGYIRETEEGKSAVYVNAGGSLNQPFVLRDFRTGNYIKAAISNSEYSPFTRFILMNVSPSTTIYAGGKVIGYANLWAGQSHNHAKGLVVGSDSSAFVQLTAGRLVCKYNIDEEIMKLDFYGGAVLNEFTISIGLLFGGSISSADFPLAFTYHLDVTLHREEGQTEDAVYTMGRNGEVYKMLPGARLTVGEGTVLTMSTMNIYDSSFVEDIKKVNKDNYNEIISTIKCYPTGKGDAILTVNGTLIAKNLGGNVHTSVDGAKVTVTDSMSVTNREITKFYENNLSSAAAADRTVTNTFKLYFDGVLVRKQAILNVEYTSSTSERNWTFVMPEVVEIQLQDGYGIKTDFAVLYDEYGEMYLGTFDSSTTKDNPDSIKVLKGSTVSYYLTKHQLFSEGAASKVTVTSIDDIHASDYVKEWTATSTSPVIYTVKAIEMTGSGLTKLSSVSFVYDTATGNVSVTLKSTGSILSSNSFSVNGTAASSSGLITKTNTYTTTVTADITLNVV